ncbi:MAG: peptide-methionine (S)-S-oxide reductase MsrA [Chloroflexota bacterium]|jgi:methionine-S-sulfoxide reductase
MRERLTAMLMVLTLGMAAVGVGAVTSAASESDEAVPDELATATFAGGCFWCTEAAFEQVEGVHDVVSGYTGGSLEDPTYEQVSSGTTGHAEAIRVTYDPTQVSYAELLDLYWVLIDPTDADGQNTDRGSQYRTAIFYHDDEQRELAQASRDALQESGRFDEPIATEVLEPGPFYQAEEYHQDFYLKAPEYYEAYVEGSQRYPFLEAIWGDEAGTD